jgi:regulatory protein
MNNTTAKSAAIKGANAKPKKKIPRRITDSYLHNAGLYYLQRFAASTGQFRTVMRRKVDRSCLAHVDQDRAKCYALIDTLIETFIRAGLLNDEIYAQGLAKSLHRRGTSTRMMREKMKHRGLSADHIAEALTAQREEAGDNDMDLSAAVRLIRRKRLGAFATKPRDRNKDLASLARAGFSYETANRALNMDQDTAEALI